MDPESIWIADSIATKKSDLFYKTLGNDHYCSPSNFFVNSYVGGQEKMSILQELTLTTTCENIQR